MTSNKPVVRHSRLDLGVSCSKATHCLPAVLLQLEPCETWLWCTLKWRYSVTLLQRKRNSWLCVYCWAVCHSIKTLDCCFCVEFISPATMKYRPSCKVPRVCVTLQRNLGVSGETFMKSFNIKFDGNSSSGSCADTCGTDGRTGMTTPVCDFHVFSKAPNKSVWSWSCDY
jgi:hypothetical protein